MTQAHAVIITGGRGERLGGVRKADLRIGGVRLIDRVVRAIGPVATPLLVAVGPRGKGPVLPEAVMIPDLSTSTGGPLAGLAAAIAALRGRGIVEGRLLSAAVDTPFLPADFAAVMLAALDGHDAAFAAWGEDFYPPNAAWDIAALADLPERIMGGGAPRSLKDLLTELGANRVDWATRSPENPFLNLNTLNDLVALGQMARR